MQFCVNLSILTEFFLVCLVAIPRRRSYLDRTVSLQLNKNRKVVGTLRGYDQFMNVVLGK
jgi:LSM domain